MIGGKEAVLGLGLRGEMIVMSGATTGGMPEKIGVDPAPGPIDVKGAVLAQDLVEGMIGRIATVPQPGIHAMLGILEAARPGLEPSGAIVLARA